MLNELDEFDELSSNNQIRDLNKISTRQEI